MERVGIAEGAYEAINEDHGLLANATELKSGLHTLAERIEGDGGASELLLMAARDLEVVGKSWPEAIEMGLRLRGAVEDIREVVRDAERKLDGVEEDPKRLELLEEKLAIWHRLLSKHRLQTPQELVDLKSKLEAQWSQWEGAQDSLDRIAEELEVLEKRYRASSSEVHALRAQVANTLTQEVLKLLHALNLPHARWEVRLGDTASDSKRGNTLVELWFSANPGTSLSEVRKTASGGERSRLMLALKAVFARSKGLQTIFFDEIDTGISGQTASQVAAIFKQMAQSLQVVVITHLPQVAAAGQAHWRIEKATEGGRTQTQLRPLEGDARVEEVARMLSGATVTPAALENARELIFVS
jgi:DNA repair protein RecN (Recombination protein N)